MPIHIPQSALDKALAEDKKRRGILDEVPCDCFTIQEIIDRGHRRWWAQSWIKKYAVAVGICGSKGLKVYRLKGTNKCTTAKK